MFSRAQLADGFRALGVVPGDAVMVHASVRAVGPIAGGPDQIHLALKDALTEIGTMMMYASCPEHYDEVGRGCLGADEERELLEKLPVFDPHTARSARDNGALVELFRTYPGSLVNDHVVRFVAWGRQAPALVAEQPWSYAYGRGSTLERFAALGGRILLIGCDHDTVTFLHHAEHVAEIDGRRVVRFKVPVSAGGERVWRDTEEFDTSDRAHPHWPDRFFARIVDTHLAATSNPGGLIGNARGFLMNAPPLLDFALDVMEAVALDASAADRLVPAAGGQ